MLSPHIVFLDAYTLNPGDLDWDIIKQCGHLTFYERTARNEVLERAAEADIIITNKTALREEHFALLPRLRLICVAATGYDVVDVTAARRHDITVCNCAGYGTRAVAQMVVAHLLEVANRVGHYSTLCRNGFWSRQNDFCCWNDPLMELDGKRLAIVGFGNIGQEVTNMLRPFGMHLFAVTSKSQEQLPDDVHKLSLKEAFATCDVVSLHCPLTDKNRNMIDAALLENARPGLILINTARGKLVDENAIAAALAEGRLGAYCCDVLSQEPPAANNPILSAPNAFVTPHVAWATPEARRRILHMIAGNIKAFLTGKAVNTVN